MSFALFAAALEKLGFRFTAVSGRVQLGADSTHPRPATHAMLIVDLDGARWLSDVGFGHSPLELIELVDGGRSEAGPWPYLLRWQDITHGSPGWAVHQRGGETDDPDGWVVRQVFTETPQYPVDYAVGNHFVATHDRSPFVTRPYIQRQGIDRYDTLDALVWTTERPGRDRVTRTVGPHEVPELLDGVFGLPHGPCGSPTAGDPAEGAGLRGPLWPLFTLTRWALAVTAPGGGGAALTCAARPGASSGGAPGCGGASTEPRSTARPCRPRRRGGRRGTR
ncbi:arylamine N-acetyltransferase family protein [Streptomyces variabilis]